MNVPSLDLRPQYAQLQAELEAAVLKVLRGTHYVLGPEVADLERALAIYTGAPHVITCASGSDALLLALMALDIQAGDEVITTPHTFFATTGAIARLGAKPVFVDIEPRSFNIDPAAIEAKITSRTKAILPVHLFGQCAEMDPILAVANRHGLPVIEDAAQAIGAKYQGRQAGTLGTIGTLSFYPTKNLGGAGDGGALTTNDEALAEKLKALRVHGSKRRYYHAELGVNSRLDTLQAAILLVKLKYLDSWSQTRRQHAADYTSRLPKSVTAPVCLPGNEHIYNQYTVRVPHRDALREQLKQAGVGTDIYYPVPQHLQQCFAYLGHRAGDFPEAERAAQESLSLPIYPELNAEQLDFVIESIARNVQL